MSEYRPKRGLLSRLPFWLKACLMKWWFGGAVFFFIGWGLFIQSSDQLDLVVALGLALGLVTDLLVNRALVFSETSRKEYRKFIFCYSKRFLSIPVNLIYGIALSACTAYAYHLINLAAQSLSGKPPGYIFLGAEPILYGVFFTGFDLLFVALKRIILKLIKKGD